MAVDSKINKTYKRVPEAIVITDIDMDSGSFKISVKTSFLEVDPITNEPNADGSRIPKKRDFLGGIEVIPEKDQQSFLDVISGLIDEAWKKK